MTFQESKGKFFTKVEETTLGASTEEAQSQWLQVYGSPRKVELLKEIVELRDKVRPEKISHKVLIQDATNHVEDLFRKVQGAFEHGTKSQLVKISNSHTSWRLFHYYSNRDEYLKDGSQIFEASKTGIFYKPWFLKTEGAWELLLLYITFFEALEVINKKYSTHYFEYLPLYAEGPFGFVAEELKKDFAEFIAKGNLAYQYPEDKLSDGQYEVRNVSYEIVPDEK